MKSLTNKEIEDILSFIPIQKGIPIKSAISNSEILKNMVRFQLKKIKIKKDLIPLLKEEIKRQYCSSIIEPGTSVGIISAQSIGQQQTQSTLNSFHKAGLVEMTMTHGVPRFEELINASKNPKIVNHKIYFKTNNTTLDEICLCKKKIVGLTIEKLVSEIRINLDISEQYWFKYFSEIYSDKWKKYKYSITMKFNKQKIYEFNINLREISKKIEKKYSDLICIYSPLSELQISVFVDMSDIDIPDKTSFSLDETYKLYLKQVVVKKLKSIYICGVPCINNICFSKEDEYWVAQTTGTNSRNKQSGYINFKHLLAISDIDDTRVTSSNIWDIYNVLGIEACRQFLIDEFRIIMPGINKCHIKLLTDRIVHKGTISSITRYTMKKDSQENSPFSKCCFEETIDNIANSAATCEKDNTKGVSASIICGKRGNFGSGIFDLKFDLESLI